MAPKKEKKSDVVRVNLSFLLEEYEKLEEAAAKDSRTPTALGKMLVMKGLEELSKNK